MGKVLFNEAAMYVGRKSKRASGTVLGVNSAYPNKIVLTHIKIGIVFATAIDRDEVQELPFCDISSISISEQEGYKDGKHMQINMKDGRVHLFAFKKVPKAQLAVEKLNHLKQAQGKNSLSNDFI